MILSFLTYILNYGLTAFQVYSSVNLLKVELVFSVTVSQTDYTESLGAGTSGTEPDTSFHHGYCSNAMPAGKFGKKQTICLSKLVKYMTGLDNTWRDLVLSGHIFKSQVSSLFDADK